MDYGASEDQRLLQETTRRFLDQRSPIGEARRLIGEPVGFDRAVWRQGAELGWASMFVPEAFGGAAESAAGVVDAAIVAEELGRVVFAGPFLPVNVVAFALARAGNRAHQELLAPLAAGDAVATWCLSGPGLADTSLPRGVAARTDGASFVLDGAAGYVQDAHVAGHLLVTAHHDAGLSQFLVPADAPGVEVVPLDALDLARRLADVRFHGVTVGADDVVGAAGAAADDVRRQLQVALVLQCAETIGAVDRALEMTVEYAKDRVAFGRPIGSFQALKHRLAEHTSWWHTATAITDHAARLVHEQAPDADLAASMAKAHVGSFAPEITRDCVQIHGGIGVTWEHDLHLYLRRVLSNEALWGTPGAHREHLCQLAGV